MGGNWENAGRIVFKLANYIFQWLMKKIDEFEKDISPWIPGRNHSTIRFVNNYQMNLVDFQAKKMAGKLRQQYFFAW